MQIQFTPVCPLGYWYPFCYIVQYDEPAPLYEERISISEKPIACTGLWPLCAFDNFVSLEVAFEIEFTDTTVCFCISFPLILLRAVEQKMGVWCMGLCLCAYVCVEGGGGVRTCAYLEWVSFKRCEIMCMWIIWYFLMWFRDISSFISEQPNYINSKAAWFSG